MRDPFHLGAGGLELLIGVVADAGLEGGEDVVPCQAFHGDDEGEAEFCDIGGVEFGEACVLIWAQTIETGAGLFAFALFSQSAGDGELAGKVRMGVEDAELLLRVRGAKNRHHRLMHALGGQRHEDHAAVIGALGDKGRMFEHATEGRDEIVAGGHRAATVLGADTSEGL